MSIEQPGWFHGNQLLAGWATDLFTQVFLFHTQDVSLAALHFVFNRGDFTRPGGGDMNNGLALGAHQSLPEVLLTEFKHMPQRAGNLKHNHLGEAYRAFRSG